MAPWKCLSNAHCLYNRKVSLSPEEITQHLVHPLNGGNGRISSTASTVGSRGQCSEEGPSHFFILCTLTSQSPLLCDFFAKSGASSLVYPSNTHTHTHTHTHTYTDTQFCRNGCFLSFYTSPLQSYLCNIIVAYETVIFYLSPSGPEEQCLTNSNS